MFVLNNETFKPAQNNHYIIYGGKNCITSIYNEVSKFHEKKTSTPITLSDKIGRVTFYVLDGSYINFEFSKQPLSRNFSGYAIQGTKKVRKVTFEYEGPFSFDYVTDGDVYATRKTGVVKGSQLLYPDADELSTFRIEEYKRDITTEHSFTAKIKQSTAIEPLVTMVAVKELSVFDEVDAQ